MNSIPIYCIQEHFLLRANLYKLSQAFSKFTVLPKPAHKSFLHQDSGRPMGGLAIIIPREFRKYATIVDSKSWRLQPVLLQLGMESILVTNNYFPTEAVSEEDADIECLWLVLISAEGQISNPDA